MKFDCPYLGGSVELSENRAQHICERHPELGERLEELLSRVLAGPDEVRGSKRDSAARMFSCWIEDMRGGKHVVTVVVSEQSSERHWITTAYITGRLAEGEVLWTRT